VRRAANDVGLVATSSVKMPRRKHSVPANRVSDWSANLHARYACPPVHSCRRRGPRWVSCGVMLSTTTREPPGFRLLRAAPHPQAHAACGAIGAVTVLLFALETLPRLRRGRQALLELGGVPQRTDEELRGKQALDLRAGVRHLLHSAGQSGSWVAANPEALCSVVCW
jgi:hypothetical protein